jgi:hypothetical protein
VLLDPLGSREETHTHAVQHRASVDSKAVFGVAAAIVVKVWGLVEAMQPLAF